MDPSALKTPPAREALLEAAERFGTPTYAYVEETLRRQCRRLRALTRGVPARLLYAMKANPNPSILRVMKNEGLGLDVVSPGEQMLAQRLGFAPERVLFSANNMTDAAMRQAQEAGALLNIGERPRLEAFGHAYPGARVCLRLNPNVEAGHHEHVVTADAASKFGIPVGEVESARAIAERHGLQIVGLHQHIGSGIRDVERFGQAVRVLLGAAEGFADLEFVNVGGGLGIPYRPGEDPIDAEQFRQAVVQPLRNFRNARPGASEGFSFWFEPGRFLVAEAGVLLMRVNTIKRASGRVFAGTDSGMGHLMRPAVYEAYHGLYNLSNPNGALELYDVVGNVCEGGDVFARGRRVQQIREGDVLAVLDAGAYGQAMASTYNLRPLPAEAMIRPGGTPELVRHRRTAEELARALTSGAGGTPRAATEKEERVASSPPAA
jgi:diaminopimelate decarboxylase